MSYLADATPSQVRAEIADAIEGVADISCTTNYRQSLKPLDAFVRFNGRTRDGSDLGYLDTWQVWVALSQDIASAEQWLDENIGAVLAALEPVLAVNTVNPADMGIGPTTVPGVIFEGVREAG